MKWTALFFCWLSLAGAAELTGNRTVYLLPMGRGLEQFIANRLTRTHLLPVVTDPAKADTIITDRVGAELEDRLKDLYPPPEPPPAPAQAAPDTKEGAKSTAEPPKTKKAEAPKAKDDESDADSTISGLAGDTANKAERAGSMATFGHGRGTIFLVDVKSRQILWSIFERPKNNSPHELDRTAARIVKRLKEDLAAKQSAAVSP